MYLKIFTHHKKLFIFNKSNPAAGSPTATMLRLHPSQRRYSSKKIYHLLFQAKSIPMV